MFSRIHKPATGILKLDCEFDVAGIRDYISTFTEDEWNEWSYRQSQFHGVHSCTRTVRVHWVDLKVQKYSLDDIELNDRHYSNVSELLNGPLTHLKRAFNGEVYKIIIVEMAPFSKILPHVDSGFSLLYTHRIHLPVVTNPGVIFSCGTDAVNMMPGNMYEINNQMTHSVVNDGDAKRIHIIVDIIENKTIQESK